MRAAPLAKKKCENAHGLFLQTSPKYAHYDAKQQSLSAVATSDLLGILPQ
jgi:hypothetical protein